MRHQPSFLIAAALLAVACGPSSPAADLSGLSDAAGDQSSEVATSEPWQAQAALPGTAVKLDLDVDFFDRPFPMDAGLEPDGTLSVKGFPLGTVDILIPHLEFVDEIRSFSTLGAVYLPFDGVVDSATLPADGHASLASDASVFLVNVTQGSPTFGRRVAIVNAFKDRAEPLSVANLLAAVPVPGLRLAANTTYALVATDALKGPDATGLGRPADMGTVLWSAGRSVDWSGAPTNLRTLQAASAPFLDWLVATGLPADAPPPPDPETIRAFTVFTTGDPVAGMRVLAARAREAGALAAPDAEFQVTQTRESHCVVEGTFSMPRWQEGEPPYLDASKREGRIQWQDGQPVQQGTDRLRFVLTIPRTTMPAGGFPLLAYGHGMNGDYRQVVKRNENTGITISDVVALRGIAASGLDAVAHGTRSPDGGAAGGFNLFNVLNPWSVRDNVRQTVADYLGFYRMAAELVLDPASCPGVDAAAAPDGKVHFDGANTFYMGHSLGSSIGGLVMAMDPDVRVTVLSGAGGQAPTFLLSQKVPVDIKAMMEAVFGFDTGAGDDLDLLDPAMLLMQMIFDEADGPNYAPLATRDMDPSWPSRHILQLQGLGDTYTPEYTAASVSCAFGLDAIQESTSTDAYAAMAAELLDRITYNGGVVRPAPVSGNRTLPSGEPATAVLRWYEVPGAPEVNPHYGSFRMAGVRYQYGCFLRTFLDDGVPTLLPGNEDWTAPCATPAR